MALNLTAQIDLYRDGEATGAHGTLDYLGQVSLGLVRRTLTQISLDADAPDLARTLCVVDAEFSVAVAALQTQEIVTASMGIYVSDASDTGTRLTMTYDDELQLFTIVIPAWSGHLARTIQLDAKQLRTQLDVIKREAAAI